MALGELGPVGYAAVSIAALGVALSIFLWLSILWVNSPNWLRILFVAAFVLLFLGIIEAHAQQPGYEWWDAITEKPQPFNGGFDGRGTHHKRDPHGPCWRWCGTCWWWGLPEWRWVCK